VASGCVDKRDYTVRTTSFEVTLTVEGDCGSDAAPNCAYSAAPVSGIISVRALREDGTTDTEFNGSVVFSLVPAGILEDSELLADGRHVRFADLVAGEASDIPFTFTRAFGGVRLLVEDLGYRRAAVVTEAACYDLYPAVGCYAKDDDDPAPGSGAAGASEVIRFDQPRLYDTQATDVEVVGSADGYPSKLDGFRALLDADSRTDVPTLADCDDGLGHRRELLVVTSTTIAGFTVTDVCNAFAPDFAHMYVYNFNQPEGLGEGDCLLELTGTIMEFQGYTEMKAPFWVIDCDPADPACAEPRCTDLVPAPVVLDATRLSDPLAMEKLEAGLVTITDVTAASEYRSCDQNGNGTISGSAEWACSNDCGDDVACVVKESYDTYFSWSVNKDGVEINVVSRGISDFDPELNLGAPVQQVTGTVRQLSFGRPMWTIEIRHETDLQL
jgi:hypothetical protein